MHACMHTCIRTSMHACMHTYIQAYGFLVWLAKSVCCLARFGYALWFAICKVFFCSQLLGKSDLQGLLLQQAIGELIFVGCAAAARYCPMHGAYFCSKLLGKIHLQDLLPMQHVIGKVSFVGRPMPQAIRKNPFAASCSATSCWESSSCRAPSCGDSGWSHISNTPPHLATPVHHIS